MSQRHWNWLVIQLGSVTASLLGLIFLLLDGTKEMLIFVPVALLTWILRPNDWRDALWSILR